MNTDSKANSKHQAAYDEFVATIKEVNQHTGRNVNIDEQLAKIKAAAEKLSEIKSYLIK